MIENVIKQPVTIVGGDDAINRALREHARRCQGVTPFNLELESVRVAIDGLRVAIDGPPQAWRVLPADDSIILHQETKWGARVIIIDTTTPPDYWMTVYREVVQLYPYASPMVTMAPNWMAEAIQRKLGGS